jgi:hypothetical protein
MKMKIMSSTLILFLALGIIFNSSCNSKPETEATDTTDTVAVEPVNTEADTEAELLKLESEAPSKEMNNNTRSAAGGGSGYNYDDECNQRCESVLDKQTTIFSSATLEREYRECIEQCMEEKAQAAANEENEKVKEYILEQAQENFQRCINAAPTEEDKEICREQYRQDKEFYYNYGK